MISNRAFKAISRIDAEDVSSYESHAFFFLSRISSISSAE